MSVPKISVLNLSLHLSLFSLLLSADACIYLPIYFVRYIIYLPFCFSVLPTIRVWQSEVNATADVGQPAMLTCAVDGYPEPTVTWTR